MKKLLSIFLCLGLAFSLIGCQQPTISLIGGTSSPTLTQTEGENGILVTTPYFTVTLPKVWKDNYEIRYSDAENIHSYRFVDPVSEETHGGHLFTIALYQDANQADEVCKINGEKFGVLQADTAYTVVIERPTDFPAAPQREEIVRQLQETQDQVLVSFAPVNGGNFIPTQKGQ
jgi:hypothetical protein